MERKIFEQYDNLFKISCTLLDITDKQFKERIKLRPKSDDIIRIKHLFLLILQTLYGKVSPTMVSQYYYHKRISGATPATISEMVKTAKIVLSYDVKLQKNLEEAIKFLDLDKQKIQNTIETRLASLETITTLLIAEIDNIKNYINDSNRKD